MLKACTRVFHFSPKVCCIRGTYRSAQIRLLKACTRETSLVVQVLLLKACNKGTSCAACIKSCSRLASRVPDLLLTAWEQVQCHWPAKEGMHQGSSWLAAGSLNQEWQGVLSPTCCRKAAQGSPTGVHQGSGADSRALITVQRRGALDACRAADAWQAWSSR